MSAFKLFCICLILISVQSEGIFTLYPLANDYFDIIYEIKHLSSQSKLHSDKEQSLFLRVYCKDHNVVSVSLTPTMEFRQEPRFPVYSRQSKFIPPFQQQIYTFLSSCNVLVKPHPRPNSIVQIIRRDNNQPIFQLTDVVMKEGYNKFKVNDKSTKWGLGERFQHKFKINPGAWTIWNRDKPWQIDQGHTGRSSSSYGHQPLYLARQSDGYTHLTYFKNTHGMLVEVLKQGDGLVYNSLGGNIHFIIFVGDKNPQKTLQKYHEFIGGIHIPPFWSLGWHQCRWGYKTLATFKNVVQGYESNDIPIDTMWNDLDYMKQKAIFTIDQNNYPSSDLKKYLVDKNLHWIPLIDVGVSLLDHESIDLGKSLNVFLKNVTNPSSYYIGEVWPGRVHFVDYLHPNASHFWKTQLNRLYQKVPFSGVWLDMNEPSNFKGNQPVHEIYKIQQSESVNMMTIDVNLKHYSTFNTSQQLTHWQVHSYYGHTSTVPTFDFLKQHGRPFIISRSNSVGTGKYAGHWTGDNSATWAFMRLSISGNFLFQIFGIQMVGADICGFNSDTTVELCSRWTQLGSLYPFARNHNQDIAKDQQPYVLGDQVLKTAQISIKQRYSLLKQLYSILVDLNGKGTFFRPVYFEFFDDQETIKDEIIETQFMLGSYLMSAPIVQERQTSRTVYFPGKDTIWHTLQYDLESLGHYSKKNVRNSINKNTQQFYHGQSVFEVANQIPSSPPLFLRSGYMIFSNKPEQRSRFLNNKFYVTAALSKQGVAINRFLTIQNYENQTVLGNCIQKNECLTQFTIKKGAAPSEFEFSWKFNGNQKDFGPIQLLSITVWEEDKEWVSKLSSIKIDSIANTLKLDFEIKEHKQ